MGSVATKDNTASSRMRCYSKLVQVVYTPKTRDRFKRDALDWSSRGGESNDERNA